MLKTEFILQIQQAQNNQFNMHIHVEYEWKLRQDDWYESDDDLEDKVSLYLIRIESHSNYVSCSRNDRQKIACYTFKCFLDCFMTFPYLVLWKLWKFMFTFDVVLSINPIHQHVQTGPVKKDRVVRPFSVYQSSSSSHNRAGGGGGGGIFSVGRKLPMSRSENKRDVYAAPFPQTRSLESPPPPPPSSPAPPLPPRVRGNNCWLIRCLYLTIH